MSEISRLKQRIETIRQTGNPVPLLLEKRLRKLQGKRNPKSFSERRREKKAKAPRPANYFKKSHSFYRSGEWRRARYDVLVQHGGRCQCCGATAQDGVKIHVDHITPLNRAWDRRLDPDNLQVLCEVCNQGKGARDATDWRSPA